MICGGVVHAAPYASSQLHDLLRRHEGKQLKNRDSDLQQGLSPVARKLVESGTIDMPAVVPMEPGGLFTDAEVKSAVPAAEGNSTEVVADGSTLELLRAVIDDRAERTAAHVADARASSGPGRPQKRIQDGDKPVSKQEELSKVIAEMSRSIPELHGVMIASTDGLPIAYDFPESESEKTAATAATALGLGQRITERSNLGRLREAVVRGDNGYLVVCGAGESAVLVLSGPANSNLGLMRIEARAASAEISRLLR